jgi:hypothetical protein
MAKSQGNMNPDSTLNTINILNRKKSISTERKDHVTIDSRDEYDRSIAANISVSVTDITHAIPATNEGYHYR